MFTTEEKLTIKCWAEDDRPREKMMNLGKHALTDAELLALLLGSGSKEESAVDLARRILAACGNNLHQLARYGLPELTRFKGIGEAKGIVILAAMELGRRKDQSPEIKKEKISCSRDLFEHIRSRMSDLPHEEFRVIYLNRGNLIVKEDLISKGGISGTVVDARLVFRSALDCLASSIVLCHNHPSGNLRPSDADLTLTKKLKEAGKMLEVQVLDHLILAGNSYFSFADEGLL
ncbi:MAG: DNA repair protein RadC [Bacteroidia bacterium]|nr:DNA repair protein RadC [Bacteroidia bacterium]